MSESFPPQAATYLDHLEIVRTSDDKWQFKLLQSLTKPSSSIRPASGTLQRILGLAEKELQCKTVVVEPYISTDFSDEYAAYYSRQFRHNSKVCKRLHFFRGIGAEERSLDKLQLLNLSDEARKAYLGYCVVRPTNPLRAGDTVLTSPHQHGKLELVHCQTKFDVHLLGHTLSVRGMPFMEQDAAVGVCADSDLWMLARYMHRIVSYH